MSPGWLVLGRKVGEQVELTDPDGRVLALISVNSLGRIKGEPFVRLALQLARQINARRTEIPLNIPPERGR